jgi:hypothetical protein
VLLLHGYTHSLVLVQVESGGHPLKEARQRITRSILRRLSVDRLDGLANVGTCLDALLM